MARLTDTAERKRGRELIFHGEKLLAFAFEKSLFVGNLFCCSSFEWLNGLSMLVEQLKRGSMKILSEVSNES